MCFQVYKTYNITNFTHSQKSSYSLITTQYNRWPSPDLVYKEVVCARILLPSLTFHTLAMSLGSATDSTRMGMCLILEERELCHKAEIKGRKNNIQYLSKVYHILGYLKHNFQIQAILMKLWVSKNYVVYKCILQLSSFFPMAYHNIHLLP